MTTDVLPVVAVKELPDASLTVAPTGILLKIAEPTELLSTMLPRLITVPSTPVSLVLEDPFQLNVMAIPQKFKFIKIGWIVLYSLGTSAELEVALTIRERVYKRAFFASECWS
ncbi:hypothetical protein ACVMAJ_006854 [Bradyrhizobium sp. USDA 4448]